MNMKVNIWPLACNRPPGCYGTSITGCQIEYSECSLPCPALPLPCLCPGVLLSLHHHVTARLTQISFVSIHILSTLLLHSVDDSTLLATKT
jgi:hypothetical protein